MRQESALKHLMLRQLSRLQSWEGCRGEAAQKIDRLIESLSVQHDRGQKFFVLSYRSINTIRSIQISQTLFQFYLKDAALAKWGPDSDLVQLKNEQAAQQTLVKLLVLEGVSIDEGVFHRTQERFSDFQWLWVFVPLAIALLGIKAMDAEAMGVLLIWTGYVWVDRQEGQPLISLLIWGVMAGLLFQSVPNLLPYWGVILLGLMLAGFWLHPHQWTLKKAIAIGFATLVGSLSASYFGLSVISTPLVVLPLVGYLKFLIFLVFVLIASSFWFAGSFLAVSELLTPWVAVFYLARPATESVGLTTLIVFFSIALRHGYLFIDRIGWMTWKTRKITP